MEQDFGSVFVVVALIFMASIGFAQERHEKCPHERLIKTLLHCGASTNPSI